MSIPVQMFTLPFTIGRQPNWIALLGIDAPLALQGICRPRQFCTGVTQHEYVERNMR